MGGHAKLREEITQLDTTKIGVHQDVKIIVISDIK